MTAQVDYELEQELLQPSLMAGQEVYVAQPVPEYGQPGGAYGGQPGGAYGGQPGGAYGYAQPGAYQPQVYAQPVKQEPHMM